MIEIESVDGYFIYMAKDLDNEGELEISTMVDTLYIKKNNAIDIVSHLTKVFELDKEVTK